MDFKLEINQNLKLTLSLEMKMSIEMLKMSATELKEFLEKKAKENPAIEISYPNKTYSKSSSTDFTMDLIEDKEESLIDFLEEQMSYLTINANIKSILYFLINNLDERGYLVGDICEFRKILKVKTEDLKKGIELLQSLDPIGVGAKDLVECLLIQLNEKKIKDQILENIIKYDLEEIGEGNFQKIIKKYEITMENLKKKLDILRSLNPKPARGFIVNNKIEYIVPDIIVEKVGNILEIDLNRDYHPTVRVKNDEKSGKNISSAVSLIKAIEKRQNTLLKISKYILNFQKEAIINNNELKTLKIKDIAYELDYHESTVSRTVNEKYIKIDGKVKKLKDYIVLSSHREKIKNNMLDLIKEENKENPLSDEKILEELSKNGIKTNRRTITKYRDELGIESSRKRKKTKY